MSECKTLSSPMLGLRMCIPLLLKNNKPASRKKGAAWGEWHRAKDYNRKQGRNLAHLNIDKNLPKDTLKGGA